HCNSSRNRGFPVPVNSRERGRGPRPTKSVPVEPSSQATALAQWLNGGRYQDGDIVPVSANLRKREKHEETHASRGSRFCAKCRTTHVLRGSWLQRLRQLFGLADCLGAVWEETGGFKRPAGRVKREVPASASAPADGAWSCNSMFRQDVCQVPEALNQTATLGA